MVGVAAREAGHTASLFRIIAIDVSDKLIMKVLLPQHVRSVSNDKLGNSFVGTYYGKNEAECCQSCIGNMLEEMRIFPRTLKPA